MRPESHLHVLVQALSTSLGLAWAVSQRLDSLHWSLTQRSAKYCAADLFQRRASHVANLHILRCLEEHEKLPDITQTFFYRSCSAALQSTEQRDREAAASRLANILSFTRRVGATGGARVDSKLHTAGS